MRVEKAIISDNCLLNDGVELKGKEQNLVILASYVEVLKDIRLKAPSKSSLTICHHETVKEDFEYT